ncbi:hypothetical protein BGX26_008800 [Mortierella sp. AD094]|nr:hypothetical protein BGX26_008800 [Mortierella sp. AD094]
MVERKEAYENISCKLNRQQEERRRIRGDITQIYRDEDTKIKKKWEKEQYMLELEYLVIRSRIEEDAKEEDLITDYWAMLGEQETEKQKDEIEAVKEKLNEKKAERKRERAEWSRKEQELEAKQLEEENAKDEKDYAEIERDKAEYREAMAKIEKAKTEPRKPRAAGLQAEKRILNQSAKKRCSRRT